MQRALVLSAQCDRTEARNERARSELGLSKKSAGADSSTI
jgi:hypothetical protein